MSNGFSKGPSPHRIHSLRPAGKDVVCEAAPADARAGPQRTGRSLLSRLAHFHATGSVAFLNWVIPYLRSPLVIVYCLVVVLVGGGVLNATLNQAGLFFRDGYVFYAAFVSLREPELSFWHYGLYFFVAPILGLTSACIAGLLLAYVSLGIGVGVAIWYAGWGTNNFYQYTLPGTIALVQCGLMATVFKQTADFIFGALIRLYAIVVAAFWAFLLLFTCATWIHWLVEWSIRPAH